MSAIKVFSHPQKLRLYNIKEMCIGPMSIYYYINLLFTKKPGSTQKKTQKNKLK